MLSRASSLRETHPRENGCLGEISIRKASEADYPAVARIQRMCPDAAQWPLGDYSNYNVLIARFGDEPAGFCAWREIGNGEAEVLNLGVSPERRGQGLASALLATVTAQATGDVFLEVAEDNGPALALYRKLGWERVGLRPGYYGRGTVDAVVMKKRSW